MGYNLTLFQNRTDLTSIAVASAHTFDNLIPFVLFFEFMIILFLGITGSRNRSGDSKFSLWGTVAGTITTITAILWSGVSASINGLSLSIVNVSMIIVCFSITSCFAIIFFLSDLE